MENSISPFSNGTEAMNWMDSNCDRCVKAFVPKNPENGMPDFDTTQRLVNLRRECRLKFAMDLGFITGEVALDIAKLIGYSKEKGFPEQCMMYSDNEDDGWKPIPRKPKDEPPSQFCLPFAMNDILKDHNVLEKVK